MPVFPEVVIFPLVQSWGYVVVFTKTGRVTLPHEQARLSRKDINDRETCFPLRMQVLIVKRIFGED